MQRINRSKHAPVGTAVFLFLGLAILPVSLRATGVQISFSPRLSAATDAWQQVAEVFGASYHPASGSQLSVVKDPDTDPSNPTESRVIASSDFAFCHQTEERPETKVVAPETRSLKLAPGRRGSQKPAAKPSLASHQVAIASVSEAIKASFETHATTIGKLGALKVATFNRGELLKSIDKNLFRISFEGIAERKNLLDSKSLRTQVRIRKSPAGPTAKAAEHKVFSALASVKRRECDRAVLTGVSTGTPDHSEF